MEIPTYYDIEEAHNRIRKFIHETPIFYSDGINRITGANIFFKCENLQKVGAFKYRGATNAVQLLTDAEAQRGVLTHSSGNHAQALALAAKTRGIKAHIVMPINSSRVKINAVEEYGGKIYFCEPNLKAREAKAREIQEQTGALFIHPYDNPNIIAGQGTVAKEMFQILGTLDAILAPIGGGGLMSGTAIATKFLSPYTKIYGVEPANADDARRSLEKGEIVEMINPNTIADGLRTQLSQLTFEIIRDKVNKIFGVSEESIIKSMRLIWERLKLVIEPSAAVSLAAILENPSIFKDKIIGIILSGGNVDIENLPF
ncbi:MAG TPA: pyridoxal-phosphate dependent enzyme [Bacteroidota bacterium]|nr:pyridoxal-phosphate dependent enzyme [Bacteroidota bacterium]